MDELLAKEEKELTEYIEHEFGNAAITLGGGAYLVKTHEEKDSAIIEAGNYVLWNLRITNQTTGALEYTSDRSGTKFSDSYADGGPEITKVLSSKIDAGLQKFCKGERGDMYIPSRFLLLDYQPRIFSVEVVDVIKDLSVYQEMLMYKYFKQTYNGASVDTIKKAVSSVDKTEYNVMYHIIDKGTGEAITEGMSVETKTSISYMVQEDNVHQYVNYQDKDQTWHTGGDNIVNTLTRTNCIGEILNKMRKGGKVVVAMSSKLFWKDEDLPKNASDQYYIPKWSVVVFTIDIKRDS